MKKKRPNVLLVLIILVLTASALLVLTNRSGSNDPDSPDATPTGGTVSGNDSSDIGEHNTITPTLSLSPTLAPTSAPESTPVPTSIPEVTAPPVASPVPTTVPTQAETGSDEPVPDNIEALKIDLEEYIAAQAGKYGLYYKNMVTGEAFGIHDKDEYIAASTTKLPMNLLLYKKVASGEVNLNSKLTYKEEDFEAGTGIIQKSPYGTEYTVRETARLSIEYSDNCGINMIIRLLGIDNIRQYMQDLGGTVYYGSRHRSCPYDLALYTEELYRFYQENPKVAGLLVDDLQNTMWNDRINKLLPGDVKVSHKIGNYNKVYNDVGIVFATEPYVLAVMSDNIDQSVASDVIANLSRKIFDYVENQ